jgi:homocysteine S-methyltransferase
LIKNKDVDILAYETIPNLLEVKAILNVIKTHPGAKAWIVVSCKNKD